MFVMNKLMSIINELFNDFFTLLGLVIISLLGTGVAYFLFKSVTASLIVTLSIFMIGLTGMIINKFKGV